MMCNVNRNNRCLNNWFVFQTGKYDTCCRHTRARTALYPLCLPYQWHHEVIISVQPACDHLRCVYMHANLPGQWCLGVPQGHSQTPSPCSLLFFSLSSSLVLLLFLTWRCQACTVCGSTYAVCACVFTVSVYAIWLCVCVWCGLFLNRDKGV